MNVAYHCSDLFAPILCISIVSLLENNKDIYEINIYVIEHNVSDNNKNKIKEYVRKYGRSLFFIPMPDINQTEDLNLIKVKKKWIFDSYCRLFLHHLLPESVERVLYLDSDVCVLGTLAELWSLDLHDKCVAAVSECLSESYYKLFDFDNDSKYCNSGVILFDLKIWQSLKMDDEIRNYIKKNNGYVFFMEQTVFSYITQGKVYTLPLKYNITSITQILNYDELFKLRKFSRFYSKDEVDFSLSNPKIIHMTSSFFIKNRVWNDNTNHPMKHVYKTYVDLISWGSKTFSKDNRTLKQRLIDYFVQFCPKAILLPIVSFVYNCVRIKLIERKMNKIRARNRNSEI